MTGYVEIQDYPPPTELPAMRAGELDGRYMDCAPALAPLGDSFTDIGTLTLIISRRDGANMALTDLQSAGGLWETTLDESGRIVTVGLIAPPGSAGNTYLLTLACTPTREGRTFIRDWFMSVLPLLG